MGRTNVIRAFPSETILDIMEKIRDARGIPVDGQRIIYGGRQMEVARTLRGYHIKNGSTVTLVLRLRGGKPVILLYPSVPLDVTVTLELSPLWSFSALYPKPASNNRLQEALEPEVSLLAVPFETLKKLDVRCRCAPK